MVLILGNCQKERKPADRHSLQRWHDPNRFGRPGRLKLVRDVLVSSNVRQLPIQEFYFPQQHDG